jgi:pimeloyl-ACP methyl ester carboxylesterase
MRKFSTAAYGTLLLNYCNQGKGYLRDLLRPKSDLKTAVSSLEIDPSDMLLWSTHGLTGNDKEMFKPKLFVCRDRRTDSIVVSVRGSFDMQDFLTDLNAEYEPFLTGFVHRGVLRTTMWIEENHLEDIIGYMETSGCSNLNIVGHSLGGAIAVVLVMIIKARHWERIARLSSFKKIHAYTYGAPPCVSTILAEEYKAYMSGYIFESDLVPRISYGSILDFRELIVCANEAMKTQASEREKMRSVDARRKN